MILIVDYGVGNLMSVQNMAKKAGAGAIVSGDVSAVKDADKIILPGVGHFNHGMKKLRESGLVEALNHAAMSDMKPILGICLGSQILGNGSEEGDEPGLGWINMKCRKFPKADSFPVPHMMWNEINIENPHPLFATMEESARYYFVHSFFMECADPSDVVATTNYGQNFASVVRHKNIIGTQFHPEKSIRYGLALISAFNSLEKEDFLS
ncbi:MAG: imidazole glycerol phosphate synthase subunit HisH [Hyphomicrobiales bacterium]